MAKSTAPSGLKLARSGEKFTASWKIPKDKYASGQSAGKRIRYSAKNKKNQWVAYGDWTGVSVGKTATSKAFTIERTSWYPYNSKVLNYVAWRVKGTTKSKTASAWSTIDFKLEVPNKPSLSVSRGTWPQATFSWSVSVKDNDKKVFSRWSYKSVLLKNSNVTKGEQVNWNSTVGAVYTANGNEGTVSGSKTITEDSGQLNDGNSYTRWFRVQAFGPRGASTTAYTYITYANPNAPKITKHKLTTQGGKNLLQLWFDTPKSTARPLSEVSVQYLIDSPDAGMSAPDGTWTEGQIVKANDTTSGAVITLDRLPGTNECLWARAVAKFAELTTPSPIYRVTDATGPLSAPENLHVETDPAEFTATVTADNTSASDVSDSFLVVRYYSDDAPNGYDIGIIEPGEDSVIVQCPEWTGTPRFGVYAAAPGGCYTETVREADNVTIYAVAAEMTSEIVTQGGSVPEAPAIFTAVPTTPSGTIRVVWEWSWKDADAAEISWSDHDDAWQSTDPPQTFTVTRMNAAQWNISGLQTGQTWYVRVRLLNTANDQITYGAYSDIISVDLSSAPLVPMLILSDAVITQDGQVTASWSYSTTDGTGQAFAEVAEVTEEGGELVYTTVGTVQTAQHLTLDATDLSWSAGESHDLVVRVSSASGRDSDGWSDPRTVQVAEALEISITQTSLETVTEATTDEEGAEVTNTFVALRQMPFTITVEGAGEDGTTMVAIERAAAYHVDRPDETDFNGYEGETVALIEQTGEEQITIDYTDLLGRLDDTAEYRIIATIQDTFGQSATADALVLSDSTLVDGTTFTVAWAQQPEAPTGTVTIDREFNAAMLTPIAPEHVAVTDVCDIYRLSIDRPELVYQGATFGETYVDPYPAIGQFGGYRFITRTVNGDYITADDSFAWFDNTDNQLKTRYNIIDFDDGQAMLELDVEVSNQWRKDFKETQYLGGSVQGDWNKAVNRTASVSFTAIPGRDDDLIEAMRRLAVNDGICHVRTKDGSSYPADVQVQEKYNYASGVKTYDYQLTITRIEPEELDGMTLAAWNAVHEDVSE